MTVRRIPRAAFFAGMLGIGLIAAAPAAHAARNAEAEQYVQENATAALSTLGDRSMSTTQRRQTFDSLMARFSVLVSVSFMPAFLSGMNGWRTPMVP